MGHRYAIFVDRSQAVTALITLAALATWSPVSPIAVARLPLPWGSFLRVVVPMLVDSRVVGSHWGLR